MQTKYKMRDVHFTFSCSLIKFLFTSSLLQPETVSLLQTPTAAWWQSKRKTNYWVRFWPYQVVPDLWWCGVNWTDLCEVILFWTAVQWSEVKWSEVKWSEVKWSEVKWSEVKWAKVNIGDVSAMYIIVILYWGHLIVLWLFHLVRILYCGCNWFCNVRVCVCVGFVKCGCVCVGFEKCGCVCVGFVKCGCVYLWVL
jgi:hypothetical protein